MVWNYTSPVDVLLARFLVKVSRSLWHTASGSLEDGSCTIMLTPVFLVAVPPSDCTCTLSVKLKCQEARWKLMSPLYQSSIQDGSFSTAASCPLLASHYPIHWKDISNHLSQHMHTAGWITLCRLWYFLGLSSALRLTWSLVAYYFVVVSSSVSGMKTRIVGKSSAVIQFCPIPGS